MFTFIRDKTDVKVQIEAKSSVQARWFVFTWHCSDEVYADLLVKSFEANLEEKLKKARKESYDQGWKNAKAKQKRETYFGGWI